MKSHKKLVAIAAVCGLAISLSGCDQGNSPRQKIGCVDMATVLKDSPVGRLEAEHTGKVMAILIEAGKKAEAQYASLPTALQAKSREADTAMLNGQWRAEQQQARARSVAAIQGAVEEYRKQNGLDVVLNNAAVIAGSAECDISQKIITRMAAVHVDYGELPEIGPKARTEPAKSEKNSGQQVVQPAHK